MEKGLSNKGNRVYLKNGKNVKICLDYGGEGEWSMIGLERRAGPDDLRQFGQSKGFLLYSNSHRRAGVNFYF